MSVEDFVNEWDLEKRCGHTHKHKHKHTHTDAHARTQSCTNSCSAHENAHTHTRRFNTPAAGAPPTHTFIQAYERARTHAQGGGAPTAGRPARMHRRAAARRLRGFPPPHPLIHPSIFLISVSISISTAASLSFCPSTPPPSPYPGSRNIGSQSSPALALVPPPSIPSFCISFPDSRQRMILVPQTLLYLKCGYSGGGGGGAEFVGHCSAGACNQGAPALHRCLCLVFFHDVSMYVYYLKFKTNRNRKSKNVRCS
jgi:hypothetical protein